MGRSKKNYDHLVDFFGNYLSVNSITGVTRLINGSPNDLVLNPPTGLGDVTISVSPLTTLIRDGDDISRLNNDVGYIKGVEYLNDIGDVNAPAPDRDQVLTWDGNEWIAAPTKVPDAFLFRGRINVDVDHPEPDPQYGWTYVQSAAGVNALASWVGIVGDAVQENDLVIYAVTDEWQVVSNPFQGPNITDLQVVINPEDDSYPGGHLTYNDSTGAFFFTPAYTAEHADLDNPLFQPDTYDERYVRRSGDLMSGDLSFNDGLKVRFLGEGDINAVTELRLGAGVAGTGLTLTNTTIGSDRLNVEFWVGPGAPEPGNPGTNVPTLSSKLDGSLGPLFSYYGQVAEDYNIVNKIYVDELFEETLELCLRVDGSNVMEGNINMNGPTPTILFNEPDSKISFKTNTTLSVGPHGSVNQLWSQTSTRFRRKGVRFEAHDNKNVFEISLDHAVREDGFAKYFGQILDPNHVANKQYVDQGDAQVALELVDLEQRVHNNEFRLNGILDEVEAEGYIKDLVVKDTVTGEPGTDAEVTIENSNELTFTIPRGQKGERGQSGLSGSNGGQGPKGDKGDEGQNGEKGQKGQQGRAGSNGQDGTNTDIKAGTATKLGYNAAPTVSEREEGDFLYFDFGIPGGQKGEKGQRGIQGEKGAPGEGGSGGIQISKSGNSYYIVG